MKSILKEYNYFKQSWECFGQSVNWFMLADLQFVLYGIKADKVNHGLTLCILANHLEILDRVVNILDVMPE